MVTREASEYQVLAQAERENHLEGVIRIYQRLRGIDPGASG